MNRRLRFPSRGSAVIAAGIGIATLAVYWPALHGQWLWDDGLEIANNPLVQSPDGWWKAWVAPAGLDYLPVKDMLQWLEWHLWHGQVLGYHLASIVLHWVCALLLWRVLSKLGVRHGWLAALLFAVHPLAVESVAWIAEFKNPLSLAFLLLAFGAFIDGAEAAAACWFLAAMLCKSSVVMFPFVLLLFAWWTRGRLQFRDWLRAAPFFAIAAGCAAAELWFQWHRAMRAGAAAAPMLSRVPRAAASLLWYARDCVWPFRLAPVYPGAEVAAPHPPYAGFADVALVLIAGLLCVVWARRSPRGRPVLFGLGWWLLNLIPALGLVTIAYMRVAPRADHFAYLALAGACGLAAAGVSGALRSRVLGTGLLSATLAVAGVFAFAAHAYAGVFRNERSLWSYAVGRAPDAWLARNNLGRVDLNDGRPQEALDEFLEAERLRPDSAEVEGNLGAAFEALGEPNAAEIAYRDAARLEPDSEPIHYDLGKLLLENGRVTEAARELERSVQLDPRDPQAHNNLGLALARLGRSADAVDQYRVALSLSPALPEAHLNLGNVLFRAGNYRGALAEYQAALRAAPHYAAAHRNLAVLLERLGRFDEARAQLEAAEADSAAR